MDVHAYEVLPRQFRKAFEEVNGELPESEFIRNIWMDIAVKWFAGWCLAVEHADELRPPIQTLTAPAPTRTFVLTVTPGELPMIQEPKLPGSAQTEPMRVTPQEAGHKDLREYQVPPPPSMPAPCQAPWPGIPVTAAEAAAASVEPVEPRKFIIINASSDSSNSWRWLVEVEEKELVKIGSYPNREDANAALKEIEGAELMGSIYAISDARLKFWQQNPNLLYMAREVFTGPAPHTK